MTKSWTAIASMANLWRYLWCLFHDQLECYPDRWTSASTWTPSKIQGWLKANSWFCHDACAQDATCTTPTVKCIHIRTRARNQIHLCAIVIVNRHT
mmetsp:Transcript_2943/g.8064  ORF Transcript_2943/g.8064 Transcript_2943/m.8064 type:complete len:96 (-) Transcript_2943:339-626(-)